jgi:hypothetical protein
MPLRFKLLSILFCSLLGLSIWWLYSEYKTVDRLQKKAIRVSEETKLSALQYPTLTASPAPPQKRVYGSSKSPPTKEASKKEAPKTVSPVVKPKPLPPPPAEVPPWVQQSPMIIALGLWVEMFKNLVTLILSFLTAMFMYWTWKKEKNTEVIDAELIE